MDEHEGIGNRQALETHERLREELAEILADLLILDLKQTPAQSSSPAAS